MKIDMTNGIFQADKQTTMKLIDTQTRKRFAEIGNQRETSNPLVVAKFFNPCGSQTWYATEYNPETNVCMGYVTGMGFDEWGTFSIDELESLRLSFGLTIERDLYFKETPFDEVMNRENGVALESKKELEKYRSSSADEYEIDR